MGMGDRVSARPEQIFQILDEPNVCVLVLDRDVQVVWANTYAGDLLNACGEELPGCDASRVFDTYLAPLVQESEAVRRLIAAMRSRTEVPRLDLLVRSAHGEEERFIYSSQRMEREPFAGMWVLRMRNVTDRRQKNEGLLSANWQLQVLNQIMGVSASSLSLDELLETSLTKTLDLLDFDVGLTYLLNPERTTALIRSHHMVPGKYLSRNRAIKIHHWPWNFIFIAGQPRYIELRNRPSTVEGGILTSLEVSALACIPILAESVVVGALFIGSRERQGLEDEERRLLEAIGQEIGSGVLRSMLHKRLEAAHRETNLYLDIMTHDIKNAENVASLYCDLLIDTLEGDAAGYARRLRESIRKSTGVLQNVATIRRILQESPDLRPVRLSHVIRVELDRIPEVDISFEDSPVEVWADDLLPEVFRNLIGNAARFGGPNARITIRVGDHPGEEQTVVVAVEDTGPGIPDGMKEAIFHRLQKGGSQGYGEGLGLYIAGMLVERYGGQIWVEDRVEGRPYLGASFRFTLREVVVGERDG